MGDGVAWRSDNAQALSLVIISGFLIWRHSENISRLVKGTESKLGKKT
jgi:glycerol-3-phosphate acyltransferase PlsY